MNVEKIESIGIQGGVPCTYFWMDIGDKGVRKMVAEGRRIVIIGCGINAYFAELFLTKIGIEVWAYADNDGLRQRVGEFRGKHVYHPIEIMKRDDVYIVVCVPEINIHMERIHVWLNKHSEEYSICFKNMFHDFSFENENIFNAIMESVNYIALENETQDEALPYFPFPLGEAQGKQLGNVNWLLDSTAWSHCGYNWCYEYLQENGKSKALDIGPGYGLISCVFLNLFNNVSFHYLIWRRSDTQKSLSECKNAMDKGLYKVSQKFKGRVSYNYGFVECDEDSIKEKYDLIILTEVFEHFATNPVPVMKRIAGGLNNRGRIMLTTPAWGHINTYFTWRDLPEASVLSYENYSEMICKVGHVYQYDKSELDEIFDEAGLEVLNYRISESNNHNYWLGKKDG